MFKHSMIGGFTSIIFSSLLQIWTGLWNSLYTLQCKQILKNPILNRPGLYLIHKCIINLVILHHVIYMQLLFNSVLAQTNNVRPIFADDPIHCTAITGTNTMLWPHLQQDGVTMHSCCSYISYCMSARAICQNLASRLQARPKGVCQHCANNYSYCISITVSAIYHIIIVIAVPFNFPSVHAICSSMNKLSDGAMV